MTGEYSVPCQRCGTRGAMQKRHEQVVQYVFSAATNRSSDQVRLCASCDRTVASLAVQVAKVRR
jgi:hypothetical protein